MRHERKEVDTNSKIDVIFRTHRGRIGLIILILDFIWFSKGSINFLGLIVFMFVGAALIASVGSNARATEQIESVDRKKAIKLAATKCIGDYLYVNETDQTWCVPSAGLTEYAFSDLIDFNVIQDGETISSANILNAVAGGMIFGLAGTLVGANKTKTSKTCSKLQVQMNVNSISNPVIRIDLISDEVKRSSDQYKKAVANMEEITGVLRVIKSRNENK